MTASGEDLPGPSTGAAPPAGEAAISLAFFDPERDLHGTVRRGLTLIFGGEDGGATEGAEIQTSGDAAYRAILPGRMALEFEPITEAARLGGARVRVCRVTGTVEGRSLDCLGTAAETLEPPRWEELDAFRAVSALFDPDHAVLVVARRPRGVAGHGHELVSSAMLTEGELRAVEEARLSTVYDGDGRQRTASLELFLPGEDFPRRAAGEVTAGTTLELPGLLVNASVFDWRMEGREGAGGYELTVRNEPPTAA